MTTETKIQQISKILLWAFKIFLFIYRKSMN